MIQSHRSSTRLNPRRSGRLPAFIAGAAMVLTGIALSGSTPGVGATTSSGERTVLTSITPCRLADTRPNTQVGDRGIPLGAGETHTFAARGAQGECTAAQLPTDAVALALNMTQLGATERTFLTVWPDGTLPNSSSLNPTPGAPPTPNGVTTRLSSTGSFNVFNNLGSVNVIIDVVGYYTDHDHDDRYDTSAEVDTKISDATTDFDTSAEVDAKITAESERLVIDVLLGTNGPVKQNIRDIQANENEIEQERRIQINRFDFHPVQTDTGGRRVELGAYVPSSTSNNQLWAAVTIPTGATVTGVQARVIDDTAAADLEVRFYQVAPSGVRDEFAPTMTSSGSSSSVRTLTGSTTFTNTTLNDQFSTYEVRVQEVGGAGSWGTYADDLQIVGFYVDYEFEVEPVL